MPVETFQQLKVEVNPRYGTYDPATASLTADLPAWITPYAADQ